MSPIKTKNGGYLVWNGNAWVTDDLFPVENKYYFFIKHFDTDEIPSDIKVDIKDIDWIVQGPHKTEISLYDIVEYWGRNNYSLVVITEQNDILYIMNRLNRKKILKDFNVLDISRE